MRPDLEWRFGDEPEQRPIDATPPSHPPSRRQRALIALVIIFIASLVVMYSSAPHPQLALAPTAAPTPTQRPRSPLEAAIDQEAHALATYDAKALMDMQDPDAAEWQRTLGALLGYWEQPDTGPLYTILNSGTLAADQAWAEVVQYRNGQYFRETRFYRQLQGRWMRTRPDPDFWKSGPQTIHTERFDLVCQGEEVSFAGIRVAGFEQVDAQACKDLNCPAMPDGSFPRVMTMTLVFQPQTDRIWPDWQSMTLSLPSPRVLGLYFQGPDGRLPGNNEVVTDLAYSVVAHFVARVVSGGEERWSRSRQAELLVGGIGAWETNRLYGLQTPDLSSELSPLKALPSLEDVWAATIPYTPSMQALATLWPTTQAVVAFIDQQYGPYGVRNFLRAIGPAQSLPEAIEKGLGVSYAEFEQQWQAWLK